MPWVLAENVYFAAPLGNGVLLDLRKSKREHYYGVPKNLTEELCRISLQEAPASDAAIEDLHRRGLIAEANSLPDRRNLVTPTLGLFDDRLGQASLCSAAGAAADRCIAGVHLKFIPLRKMVTRIRLRKAIRAKTARYDAGLERAIATAFAKSGRLLSPTDKCLTRSIALIDRLASQNLFPDLVIGVKSRPFAAHAWVQSHDFVLNDGVDQILNFTPILAV